MSIFKKINKETGEEAQRYIVFDGDVEKLKKEIHYFDMYRSPDGEYFDDLYDFGYWAEVVPRGNCNSGFMFGLSIKHKEKHAGFHTIIMLGWVLMPYRNRHKANSAYSHSDIDFSGWFATDRNELEALYPSDKYDTVEVKK